MAVDQLAYLCFEVSNLERWITFATDILGLSLVWRDRQGARFGYDVRLWRIWITEGPADDLVAVGWEVADAATLAKMVAGLKAAGVGVTEGDALQAETRDADHLVRFTDPSGIVQELVLGQRRGAQVETPVVDGGFVAGDFGMGHVVLSADNRDETLAFYQAHLGLRLSDFIVCEYFGYPVDIAFLHTPSRPGRESRHHSLALGAKLEKNIHHFMLEVHAFDEVGKAYDRTIQAGIPLMNTLGRHPNDRMFSFYAFTPSGFQFEFGWGGRTIDDAAWTPSTHDCVSEWGHQPPVALAPRRRKPPASEGAE